jgi:hypothetical protein
VGLLDFILQLYDALVHEEDVEMEVLGINVVKNSNGDFKFCVHICYFVPIWKTKTSVLEELTFLYSTGYHVRAKTGDL